MPTAEEFGEYVRLSKPYIIYLENMVQDCQYGEMDLRLTVRSGVVEKVTVITSKTWLKKGSEAGL
jgi:hypothetical protein